MHHTYIDIHQLKATTAHHASLQTTAAIAWTLNETKLPNRMPMLPRMHAMQARPFGSHVSGLDSHKSDLDVVVTGVMVPDARNHDGTF